LGPASGVAAMEPEAWLEVETLKKQEAEREATYGASI
jgi:hypothetical protein